MTKTLSILAALCGAALTAQSITVPQGLNGVEGNSSNTYPWARGNFDLRIQQCYDSSHFINQSVGGPVLISRLKWRANSTATTYAGGTYNNVTVDLATSNNDWSALSTTFATNRGSDYANVFTGTVTVLPLTGVGTGIPNIYFVDLTLATPFLYDPNNGDLLVEVAFGAGNATGTFGSCDVQTTNAMSSRMYATTAGATTGTFTTNHGLVMEFDYAPVVNAALKSKFGTGCYSLPNSFYEDFPGQAALTYDLGGSTATPNVISGTLSNNSYLLLPGTSAYYAPNTTAGALLSNAATPGQITDGNFTGPLTLPWTFNYPGGSCSVIHAASDGYLHLGPTTSNSSDFSATPEELLGLHPRLAISWYDWYATRNLTTHPDAGIYYDVDPSGQTVYITWHNFGEYAVSAAGTTVANFQIALHQNGNFEFRYAGGAPTSTTGNVTWTRMIVGFSQGGGVANPGSVDISASMPYLTGDGLTPPALDLSARPIMGTTVNVNTTNCGNATVGLLLLSFTPGTGGDLGAFGMAGCNGYVDLNGPIQVGFPITAGVGSLPILVPNSPSLNGFVGYLQSGILVPGYNTLGALATNGVMVTLGQN